MGFKQNRLWLAICAVLIAVGGFMVFEFFDRHEDISTQQRQRLTNLASAFNTNLSEQLRASSRMLDGLAMTAPSLLKQPNGRVRLNARMAMLSESVTGIRSILLVNAQGTTIASNRPELIGQDMSSGQRFTDMRAANDPKTLYVSAPFTTPLGTYTIGLGRGLQDGAGAFDGYLFATLTPDYFGVLMKSLLYAPDMRLSIAHSDGLVIYSTQTSPDIRGFDLSTKPDSLFNRHMFSGQRSSFSIDNGTATSDLRFVAIHTVLPAGVSANKPLVVAVSREASAVFSDWRTALMQMGGLYFGMVLTMVLAYWGYVRRQRAYHRVLTQKEAVRQEAESIAKSERFIRTITDAMPDLVAYFDFHLRCCFANKAYLDWYKMDAQTMIGSNLRDLLGESLYATNKAYIDGVLSGQPQQFERFLTKRDGSVGHVLANYIPDADEQGRVIGFILLVTDIKAMRMAEAGLKVAASVFEHTADGIMVTDGRGVIQSVNPAFTTITGYLAHEAVGQTPRLLRSDHHEAAFHASVWQQITDHGTWQGEIWNRRKNGELFVMWQAITCVDCHSDELRRYISVFHDVTDAWHNNERTRHLAFHDALTGLPNRTLLLERIERNILLSDRQPRRLAVLFLDLDGFKQINDQLGHAAGDELLKSVAGTLQGLVRQTDTVARLGGDEFVVLLDNPAGLDEVLNIASRTVTAIHAPVTIGDTVAKVGTSIGIAWFPEHGRTPEALLQSADQAMYLAKQAGKNSYRTASTCAADA